MDNLTLCYFNCSWVYLRNKKRFINIINYVPHIMQLVFATFLHVYIKYEIMLSCWELEAKERPKFSDLVVTVNNLLERDAGYLELLVSPTTTMKTTFEPGISPAESTALPHIEVEIEEGTMQEIGLSLVTSL